MARPRRFSDSFTTHEATFSVDVARPFGEKTEAVILKIDCSGTVSFREDGADLLIEMLERRATTSARGAVSPGGSAGLLGWSIFQTSTWLCPRIVGPTRALRLVQLIGDGRPRGCHW